LASKLNRKFSDKMQVTGANDEPLIPKEVQIVVNFGKKTDDSTDPDDNC